MYAAVRPRHIAFLIVIILAKLLVSCASVQLPTGGDKDEMAPVMLGSNPEPFSRGNSQVQQVTLDFNEDIDAGTLYDKLVIIPRYNGNVEVTTKRRQVRIKLDKPLAPNTTYRFIFRDGIKDLTEGNVPRGLTLVFSTGENLDTLSLRGQVLNAFTNKPLDGLTVAASSAEPDSLLLKPAAYFAFTDSTGRFRIDNLPVGAYRILAFTDKNKNLQYEDRLEQLAFQDTALQVPADTGRFINLRFGYHDSQLPKLISYQQVPGGAKLIFNKGMERAIPVNAPADVYAINTPKEVVIKGLPVGGAESKDSVRFAMNMADSSGNIAQVNVVLPQAAKADTAKLKGPQHKFEPGKNNSISLQDGIAIKFERPVTRFDSSRFLVLPDSLPAKQPVRLTWNIDRSQLKLSNLKATKRLYVTWPAGTFTLAGNVPIPADTAKFLMIQESSSGIINVRVQPLKTPYQVELLDENYKVIKVVANEPRFQFREIPQGKFWLRLVDDRNGNGRLDGGNYRLRRQPERMMIYKDQILIKANFEIDEISLGF